MITVDTHIDMRIDYSMTFEEAHLIFRITDGYVALARYLTEDVRVRFPEPKEKLEQMLSSLRNGTYEAIKRAAAAAEVHAGRAVAVPADEYAHMRERLKKLDEIELRERERERIVASTNVE